MNNIEPLLMLLPIAVAVIGVIFLFKRAKKSAYEDRDD